MVGGEPKSWIAKNNKLNLVFALWSRGTTTDLGDQDDTEVRNGKMDDEEDGEDDEDDNDYEDEEEGDDQDDTEVRDGEMDEEEDHPVLVLLKQSLPQQVE